MQLGPNALHYSFPPHLHLWYLWFNPVINFAYGSIFEDLFSSCCVYSLLPLIIFLFLFKKMLTLAKVSFLLVYRAFIFFSSPVEKNLLNYMKGAYSPRISLTEVTFPCFSHSILSGSCTYFTLLPPFLLVNCLVIYHCEIQ